MFYLWNTLRNDAHFLYFSSAGMFGDPIYQSPPPPVKLFLSALPILYIWIHHWVRHRLVCYPAEVFSEIMILEEKPCLKYKRGKCAFVGIYHVGLYKYKLWLVISGDDFHRWATARYNVYTLFFVLQKALWNLPEKILEHHIIIYRINQIPIFLIGNVGIEHTISGTTAHAIWTLQYN